MCPISSLFFVLADKSSFGPYSISSEYSKRIKASFTNNDQLRLVKKCNLLRETDTDLTFRIQRDDSSHHSVVTYFRFDTNKREEFVFYGGFTDHTRLEYDGRFLTCHASKASPRCNMLALEKPVRAMVISVDLYPRNGTARDDRWSRNSYDITGSFYTILCRTGKNLILFVA